MRPSTYYEAMMTEGFPASVQGFLALSGDGLRQVERAALFRNYTAGDAITGISSRVGLHVVGLCMDDD